MIRTETELLENARRALEQETGLHTHVEALEVFTDQGIVDAILLLDGDAPVKLKAEIKAWAQHINTGALINQVQRLGRNGILVTDYVNPQLADRLKLNKIQFMDAAGNAFIRAPGIHVYVTGRKRIKPDLVVGDGPTQLFNPTGLKVTYILLRDPGMVNATYRDIAEQANVALGTVGAVMRDLKDGEYVLQRGNRRLLRHYEKLLNRWVENYPEKLRPKLRIGRFTAGETDWWERIRITAFNGQWGGEIAAARYTNILKPQVATVYLESKDRLPNLVRAARLRKLDEFTAIQGMEVHINTRFWALGEQETETVDPVLTYADLVATADPRNLEVAQEIHRKYLVQRIREN